MTGREPIDVAGLSRAERDQMLRRAYETQGLSIRGLARAAGLAYTTVADALKRAGAKRAALNPRAVAIAVACGADDAELAERFGRPARALSTHLRGAGLPAIPALRRQALAAGRALGAPVEELARRFGMEPVSVAAVLGQARAVPGRRGAAVETPDATYGLAAAAIGVLGADVAPALRACTLPARDLAGIWTTQIDPVPRRGDRVEITPDRARQVVAQTARAVEDLEVALKAADAVPIDPKDRCLTTIDPKDRCLTTADTAATRVLLRRRRDAAAAHGLSRHALLALATGRLAVAQRPRPTGAYYLVSEPVLHEALDPQAAQACTVLGQAIQAYLAPRPHRHAAALSIVGEAGRLAYPPPDDAVGGAR